MPVECALKEPQHDVAPGDLVPQDAPALHTWFTTAR